MGALYFFSYGMPAFNRRAARQELPSRQPDGRSRTPTVRSWNGAPPRGLLLDPYPKLLPKLRLELDLAGNRTKLVVLATFTTGCGRPLQDGRGRGTGAAPQFHPGIAHHAPERTVSPVLAWPAPALADRVAAGVDAGRNPARFLDGIRRVPAFSLANLLFVYVAERGRLPILALALIVLVFLPALATKQEYRQSIAKGNVESTVDRLELFGNLMSGVFTGDRMSFRDADEVAESRIDHLSAFTYVIAKTPSVVPYWDGATYERLLLELRAAPAGPRKAAENTRAGVWPSLRLPRPLGPPHVDQPGADRRDVRQFRRVRRAHRHVPHRGDLSGLYTVLNHPGAGDGGILVAASTFRVLFNIESDFSLVFGGIVQNALLLCPDPVVTGAPPPWDLCRCRGTAGVTSERRIALVTFGDPHLLPPTMNAARALGARGWRVDILGIRWRALPQLSDPQPPSITVRLHSAVGRGADYYLKYLRFAAWCGLLARRQGYHLPDLCVLFSGGADRAGDGAPGRSALGLSLA